jgi:hypothetical protein
LRDQLNQRQTTEFECYSLHHVRLTAALHGGDYFVGEEVLIALVLYRVQGRFFFTDKLILAV